MIESVLPILGGVISAAKAMASFNDFRKKTRDEIRELVEELRENSRLCFRVVEDNVPPEGVIPLFSTAVFDRLNNSGFDFDAVKRGKVESLLVEQSPDLTSWTGKRTCALIDNIYDKIKDLRVRHQVTPNAPLHRRRIINIHKRILLLLRHAKS